jgi:hypothetical protein
VTVNCLVEKDPTSPSEPLALIARPGTEAFETVGTAPIRCVFQKPGLFGDGALILASNTLYLLDASGSLTAFTGSIAGDGLVIVDAALDPDGNSVARIATGDALYLATQLVGAVGGGVVLDLLPDSTGATSIAFLSGYWLASQQGTDALFYQKPGETSWNALEFASAEYAFDPLKGVVVVGEIAWLLGSSTLEGWRATGVDASPLEPAGGLKFDVGCRSIYAAVNCRGTLVFVDNDCSVRMTDGGEPRIISDPGLAEQIRRCDAMDLRASFFVKDQHPVYVLTLGTAATWLYDLSAPPGMGWTRATSNAYDYWRNDLFCNIGDVVLARDVLSNVIYRLDPDLRDDDGDTFTMEFCTLLEAKERPVPVANLELHMEVGGSPRAGQGSDPLIGMQASRDGAKTYGQLKYRGLGATGEYRTRVRWNALGMATPPLGMWFKFFVSDPVVRRVSGVSVNVP